MPSSEAIRSSAPREDAEPVTARAGTTGGTDQPPVDTGVSRRSRGDGTSRGIRRMLGRHGFTEPPSHGLGGDGHGRHHTPEQAVRPGRRRATGLRTPGSGAIRSHPRPHLTARTAGGAPSQAIRTPHPNPHLHPHGTAVRGTATAGTATAGAVAAETATAGAAAVEAAPAGTAAHGNAVRRSAVQGHARHRKPAHGGRCTATVPAAPTDRAPAAAAAARHFSRRSHGHTAARCEHRPTRLG